MPSASRIAHAGLPFANPMSEQAVDAAIAALPLPAGPFIVDTGCGSGEMLVRVLTAMPASRSFTSRGRVRATGRGTRKP